MDVLPTDSSPRKTSLYLERGTMEKDALSSFAAEVIHRKKEVAQNVGRKILFRLCMAIGCNIKTHLL